MASDPPSDLSLQPLTGKARTVEEWLTVFHLAFVALDPFTNEGAWILKTALRIIDVFDDADVRMAFLVTATADEARTFLGPHSNDNLVFIDPDYRVARAFGLERLPAFVHLSMDGTIGGAAEGWHPDEWLKVAEELARATAWSHPTIPWPGDPGPFEGSALPSLAT